MKYEVVADIYEGPLSLLVELAKVDLVDLFLIKLVTLTQSYLNDVKISGMDLNQLSEPLPLLGNLVAIKARGLLPTPATELVEEEVPISLEDLERRLKEYDQFKTVAQLLAELHAFQHDHFSRPSDPSAISLEDDQEGGTGFDVGVNELMKAFATVLKRSHAPVYEIKMEPWTVEGKVKELRTVLAVNRRIRFFELFTPNKHRLELVVTFLALLELMRQRVARAIQEKSFGEIIIAIFSEEHDQPEQEDIYGGSTSQANH